MALILSRRIGERIQIGDDITLSVHDIRGDKVLIGIEAPRDVQVHRMEIFKRIKESESRDSEATT